VTAYYNEIDPYVAEWLRNLIDAGHIAPGIVDERSIEDVRASELRGFTQCHFFAGIGVWSYALRRAGWPDNRPVWSGSCPCQPFSTAGKGAGFIDERHLWPAFHHLIGQCKPPVVFGEQVASKDAGPWIDLVHADMEALGYAFGAVPFPSAGIGAPHIRDRLYWVGDADSAGQRARGEGRAAMGYGSTIEPDRSIVRLADSDNAGLEGRGAMRQRTDQCAAGQDCVAGGLADALPAGRTEGWTVAGLRPTAGCGELGQRPGPIDGYWRAADWLLCRDGTWRPVEPGTFPLAHGAPARVGRLRAYGNAINAIQAQAFIECVI